MSSAYSLPFSVKHHKVTAIWEQSGLAGERVSFLGTPQATGPLVNGYGERNLLYKEKREWMFIKNLGRARPWAGRSSTLLHGELLYEVALSPLSRGEVKRHQEQSSCPGALLAAARVCLYPSERPHRHLPLQETPA